MAEALPMRVLSRSWQMLVSALDEVSRASNAMMAAEMAVIRLTHVADLPTPEDLVRRLRDAPADPPPPGPGNGGSRSLQSTTNAAPARSADPVMPPGGHTMALAVPDAAPVAALSRYHSFEQVVALIETRRDMQLLLAVQDYVRLVSYAPGRIEFEPAPGAPADLAQRLGQRLQHWTGVRWGVSVVSDGGADTISDVRNAKEKALVEEARDDPLVRAVLDAFPEGRIRLTKSREEIDAEAASDALPEVEDEWDPFEED